MSGDDLARTIDALREFAASERKRMKRASTWESDLAIKAANLLETTAARLAEAQQKATKAEKAMHVIGELASKSRDFVCRDIADFVGEYFEPVSRTGEGEGTRRDRDELLQLEIFPDRVVINQGDLVLSLSHDKATRLAAQIILQLSEPDGTWTEKERAAIDELMASQGLTECQVIRQALALYQIHCRRVHAGETVTWSGDTERARAFSPDPDVTMNDGEHPDRME